MKLVRPRRTDGRVLKHMAALCAWLDANGIPHADVPIDNRPTITDGQIRIEVFVRNPDGQIRITGPRDNVQVVRETSTRPLRAPLPDNLTWWAAR